MRAAEAGAMVVGIDQLEAGNRLRSWTGYRPIDSSFFLPAMRYFQRQLRAPIGVRCRYRPPPSVIFCGLSLGLARLITASVRCIGGIASLGAVGYLLMSPAVSRIETDRPGLTRTIKKPGNPL